MKKRILLYLFFAVASITYAQDDPEPLDAFSVMGMPRAENLAELNAITTPNPNIGSVAYNNADNKIYVYINDTDRWVAADFDEQDARQVDLVTNIDVNGTSTDAADLETNVEDAVQAIATITSRAGRVFYPPSIEIDASSTGPKPDIDLYDQYIQQYNTPTVRSTSAPATIPTYSRDQLYYYVTFADPNVFGDPTTISINDNGIMSYSITNLPTDFNSLINVVFVVK